MGFPGSLGQLEQHAHERLILCYSIHVSHGCLTGAALQHRTPAPKAGQTLGKQFREPKLRCWTPAPTPAATSLLRRAPALTSRVQSKIATRGPGFPVSLGSLPRSSLVSLEAVPSGFDPMRWVPFSSSSTSIRVPGLAPLRSASGSVRFGLSFDRFPEVMGPGFRVVVEKQTAR